MDNEKKVAFITGAAGGLGKAVVEKLLDKDFIVLVNDNNQENVQTLLDKFKGHEIHAFCFDATDEKAWKKAANGIKEQFGKVDVLFNNAGIFKIETIEETSVELWKKTMDVNALSIFLGIKMMSPLLGEGSSIINTSSIASFLGSKNRIAYAASKGAVSALTKAVAIEFAPRGIRANSVHPAYIKTQMAEHAAEATERTMEEMGGRIPLYQRISTANEVADVVVFLASDASRFMTGSEVVVDGGQSVN
ncbi:SDR family NAD(P)-dependent oxidoreductase [Candidatus Enterococcus murrayae]|uniref:SDR family oxidoreductase n=1 Tax=Candidatus Enterococcus murrayae TaxID=2815321 RepID=A0ABS3HNL8_9ENTE|nr:SDR family oxidoreductase [Enterococcus sp. MJM16]MBO0455038.1 SDR family oxidoreductase [Enterococcus sp. MJM16]